MDKLLAPQNLFKGFKIALYVNILSFILSLLIGVVWIYLLIGFWDWDRLLYLCLFYSGNIILTCFFKQWYIRYLGSKKISTTL